MDTQIQIETVPRPKRLTPTEKQVRALDLLTPDQLLGKALEAMHSLNRRQKEKRDRAKTYRRATFSQALRNEVAETYALKNRFLAALVASGRARVEVFNKTRRDPTFFGCIDYNHDFYVRVSTEYKDEEIEDIELTCHRCGGTACVVDDDGLSVEPWYVVQIGTYRFHQPSTSASPKLREVAVPCEPHDPTQPRREIPNVGLTIEAQRQCVLRACWQLEHEVGSATTTTTSAEPSILPSAHTEGVR